MKLVIKTGKKVARNEFRQIQEAYLREFKEGPKTKEDIKTHTFFLLKNKNQLLALGALIPVEPVKFNGEIFNILGVGGIMSNEKQKGYGKMVMTKIKEYLVNHDKTGIGFCGQYNVPFYEKGISKSNC